MNEIGLIHSWQTKTSIHSDKGVYFKMIDTSKEKVKPAEFKCSNDGIWIWLRTEKNIIKKADSE